MHAPIALFTYNRPAHTERLFESLARWDGLADSPLHVYCDGPKHAAHAESVARTREVVDRHAPPHATIVKREENLGLARSIITGVTELCAGFGRVIVLEDDLVLSPHALDFLNAGLDRYAGDDDVMHVSAYMYPVLRQLPASFFYREATCWGWGTWARAWRHFDADAGALVTRIDEGGLRNAFNIEESMYFYQMLCKQRDGEIDSWAIRWYASMFLRNGLALHPGQSLVRNLGFDGSGVHCNVDTRFEVDLSEHGVRSFPRRLVESPDAVQAMIELRLKQQNKAYPVRSRARRCLDWLKSAARQ